MQVKNQPKLKKESQRNPKEGSFQQSNPTIQINVRELEIGNISGGD